MIALLEQQVEWQILLDIIYHSTISCSILHCQAFLLFPVPENFLSHKTKRTFRYFISIIQRKQSWGSTAYTSPYHKLGLNVENRRNKSFITRDLSNVTIFQLIFPKKSWEARTNIFEWQRGRRMETTQNKLHLMPDCNLWMKHSKSQQILRIAGCLEFSFKSFFLSSRVWKFEINLSCPGDDKQAPLLSSSSLGPHPSHQLLINVTWYF